MPASIFQGSDTDCVAVPGSLSDVQPTAWAPSHGPYALRNLHGQTRLDLNTAERRLIACYSDEHREPNRKVRLFYQECNSRLRMLSALACSGNSCRMEMGTPSDPATKKRTVKHSTCRSKAHQRRGHGL